MDFSNRSDISKPITWLAILVGMAPIVAGACCLLLLTILSISFPGRFFPRDLDSYSVLFSTVLGTLLGQISVFSVWIAMGGNKNSEKYVGLALYMSLWFLFTHVLGALGLLTLLIAPLFFICSIFRIGLRRDTVSGQPVQFTIVDLMATSAVVAVILTIGNLAGQFKTLFYSGVYVHFMTLVCIALAFMSFPSAWHRYSAYGILLITTAATGFFLNSFVRDFEGQVLFLTLSALVHQVFLFATFGYLRRLGYRIMKISRISNDSAMADVANQIPPYAQAEIKPENG